MKRSITTLLFLTAFLSPLVQAQDEGSSCFKQDGPDFTESPKTYAVSPTEKCKGENRCKVAGQKTHITSERFLNVSTDATDEIFDAISEATSLTLEDSVSDDVGAAPRCFQQPGDKTYVAFRPDYRCVKGKLGDCVDGMEAGTPLKACYPQASEYGGYLVGTSECTLVNGSNAPDVPYSPSAARPGVDSSSLSLLSFAAVVAGFWTWAPL